MTRENRTYPVVYDGFTASLRENHRENVAQCRYALQKPEPAMTNLAETFFTVTRHAFDARADTRRRIVRMNMTQVSIERVLGGIKMAVAVPIAAYDAVTIRVNAPSGDATVILSHASDADLDVVLASGHAGEATIAAKAWSTVLEKVIAIRPGVTMHPPQPRSAKLATPPRVRAVGDRRRMATCFGGEREIIART